VGNQSIPPHMCGATADPRRRPGRPERDVRTGADRRHRSIGESPNRCIVAVTRRLRPLGDTDSRPDHAGPRGVLPEMLCYSPPIGRTVWTVGLPKESGLRGSVPVHAAWSQSSFLLDPHGVPFQWIRRDRKGSAVL